MKFWSSCLLKEILPFLGQLNRKPRFRFCWNFLQPFTVKTGNWCVHFFSQEIYLLDKSNRWNLKFPPSYQLEEILSSKFHISLIGFVYKINLLSKKLTQQFPVLTVRGCGKFHENLNPDFQFNLPKNSKISSNRQEDQNFKFHHFVLANR